MRQRKSSTGAEDAAEALPGLIGRLYPVQGGMFGHGVIRDFDSKIGVLFSDGEAKLTAFGCTKVEEVAI